jgi:SAM-dependent methyltransferase
MPAESDRLWVGSMPEAYERWLGPAVFRPFAADLARRVAARRPRRVLELAAGTGILTRELVAALDGAEITATDLNEAMVEYGRGLEPGAEWRQADALHLPFEDGAFDAAVPRSRGSPGDFGVPPQHTSVANERRSSRRPPAGTAR